MCTQVELQSGAYYILRCSHINFSIVSWHCTSKDVQKVVTTHSQQDRREYVNASQVLSGG